jgi:hypothetical protein
MFIRESAGNNSTTALFADNFKDDISKGQPAMGGLASVAGSWKKLEEIAPFIDEVFAARSKDKYREIPL